MGIGEVGEKQLKRVQALDGTAMTSSKSLHNGKRLKKAGSALGPTARYESYFALKQKEQQEAMDIEALPEPEDFDWSSMPSRLSGVPSDDSQTLGQQADGVDGRWKLAKAPEGETAISHDSPLEAETGWLRRTHYPSPSLESARPPSAAVKFSQSSSSKARVRCDGKDDRVRNFIEPSVRTDDEPDGDDDDLPRLESAEAVVPGDVEKFDIVRGSLKIFRIPERTLIYVVVKDKTGEKNVVARLRCMDGVAFGGYAREMSTDSYLVECVEAAHLATVPFSFRLEMPDTDSWGVEIPIPSRVLEKVFTPSQRKTLEVLRERFPKDGYEIHYLQMRMSN